MGVGAWVYRAQDLGFRASGVGLIMGTVRHCTHS